MSSSPERALAAQAPSGPGTEAPADSDRALDALRAARLRRQLADEGSSIFVHLPRPAIVSNEYANQRRFGAGDGFRATRLALSDSEACRLEAEASVYRDGGCDLAELSLFLGAFTSAQITERLTPTELRALAMCLIDAAHDIEAHPAAALAAQQQGGAA